MKTLETEMAKGVYAWEYEEVVLRTNLYRITRENII